MSEIDYDARKRILELQDRISELQAMSILAVAETKALKEMAILVWESQQVKIDETRNIPTVLDSMQKEWVEIMLSSFADLDMNAASKLKHNIDKLLKTKRK